MSSPCSMSGMRNFSKVLSTNQSTRVFSCRPVSSPRRHVMGSVVLNSVWSVDGHGLIERMRAESCSLLCSALMMCWLTCKVTRAPLVEIGTS